MDEELKTKFNELAWQTMLSAVYRQYAKTEDLMRQNGIFVGEKIGPTISDVVEKMDHAALQTMLMDVFEEAVRRTPTYIQAKGDMESRIAKLISRQIAHQRSLKKSPKQKVAQ